MRLSACGCACTAGTGCEHQKNRFSGSPFINDVLEKRSTPEMGVAAQFVCEDDVPTNDASYQSTLKTKFVGFNTKPTKVAGFVIGYSASTFRR